MIELPYTHRRTWPDTDRDGYVIRCEGLDVGRVYRTRMPDGERWLWAMYRTQVEGVPISGVAVDLETAATEFKTAYERMRAKAGLPQPQ